MAIKQVTTGGFGNGTFSTTIALVTLRGFASVPDSSGTPSETFKLRKRGDTFKLQKRGDTFKVSDR